MPREALIKNLERKLSSGKCDLGKVTIQYLTETEKLLSRQLRRKDITENDYKFRTIEINCIKNTIEDLQIKVTNLQDELNELKKENNYLRSEMNQLSHNFKIIEAYKRKYEQVTIEAGPSKIVKIIETKSTFVKLEIPEILAGIANNLSPRDILNFLRVNRLEARLLYSYKKCLHCNEEITDPVIIYELKIKICRQYANPTYKEAIIKAINSVDFMQLQGLYLSFDLRYDSSLSRVLFFLKKDIVMFAKELYQIPADNLAYNWLQEKLEFTQSIASRVITELHVERGQLKDRIRVLERENEQLRQDLEYERHLNESRIANMNIQINNSQNREDILREALNNIEDVRTISPLRRQGAFLFEDEVLDSD
ncbi:11606_t:CDS:2 [Gigaspora rosea]|nr:11606_t:CDS:2 [Gigaspora rosea]